MERLGTGERTAAELLGKLHRIDIADDGMGAVPAKIAPEPGAECPAGCACGIHDLPCRGGPMLPQWFDPRWRERPRV
ncbi:hypothetical protein IWX75_001067 [Arthrobacter sp. CAN_A6]|uniref:hypothetical protein n=1 Tax=Arthrobacter sp. CAN_A6 TaxID=2787721 RepID=UPI0018CBCB7F